MAGERNYDTGGTQDTGDPDTYEGEVKEAVVSVGGVGVGEGGGYSDGESPDDEVLLRGSSPDDEVNVRDGRDLGQGEVFDETDRVRDTRSSERKVLGVEMSLGVVENDDEQDTPDWGEVGRKTGEDEDDEGDGGKDTDLPRGKKDI